MIKPKIAFFDVDGTLMVFGSRDVRPLVKEALKGLQEQGVRLFIATGRAPFYLPKFAGIEFDGAICFNGSYCSVGDEVIFSNPLNKNDARTVISNAKNIGLPANAASGSRMGSNFYNEILDEYMKLSRNSCKVIEDFESLLEEDIYQLMIASNPDQDEALLKGTGSVKVVRWWARAMDVIPADAGKAPAMRRALDYFGISQEESMAFGDGGNDLEMIKFAGMGIAMGNAEDEVKKAADYITDSCEDDGIYTALKHFGLL